MKKSKFSKSSISFCFTFFSFGFHNIFFRSFFFQLEKSQKYHNGLIYKYPCCPFKKLRRKKTLRLLVSHVNVLSSSDLRRRNGGSRLAFLIWIENYHVESFLFRPQSSDLNLMAQNPIPDKVMKRIPSTKC